MSTLLKFQATTTVPSAGPSTTYRDLLVDGVSNVQLLSTDTADGPAERPFREAGTGPAISFYSERVASEFTLAGDVAIQLSGFASDAGFTGRFRARLWKVTSGGSNVETYIGMADATADFTTTTTLFTLTALTPSPSVTIAPNERLIVRISVIPTGAGGTSFGTGTATHRYNLFTTGMTLTETVSFLPNGIKLLLRRTGTTGIGTFFDLSETRTSLLGRTAHLLSTAGGTELQWTQRDPVGTIVVTELTGAAIASTSNATTYTSASFTPVANRLYLLAVVHSDAPPETTVPTIATTTGLTFVQIGTVGFNVIASNGQRLTLFRAMKASGLSTGTYTVTLADAATGCAALLAEVTGINTGGTDGSAAVRDVSTDARDNVANPIMFSDVPPALGPLETYNGYFSCFGSNLQTAPTPGTGSTALSHPDYATPQTGLFAEWSATNNVATTGLYPGCTLAASNFGVIQAELVAEQTTAATIEWISPRMKMPWFFDSPGYCSGRIAGSVSMNDGLANCGMRVKLFHRTPGGVETLVYTTESTTAFTTRTPSTVAWFTAEDVMPWTTTSGILNQAMPFAEDDRLVLRVYLINLGGTMAAGYTATLGYDHNVLDGHYDTYVIIYAATTFKLESDPPASSRIAGGLTMGGVGN